MDDISGFLPIANKKSRLLVLGSMPSEVSLEKQQYYGHKRNAFWPIMLSLFCNCSDHQTLDYTTRKQVLIDNKLAVWDVLKGCHRQGSLDTAIKMDSIILNDFHHFFSTHPDIKKVFFNGTKAELIFNRYVLTDISEKFGYLKYKRLPSTSPAYAALSLMEKTVIWGKEMNDGSYGYE